MSSLEFALSLVYVNAVYSTFIAPLIALSTVARITSSVDLAKSNESPLMTGFHGALKFDRSCLHRLVAVNRR